MTGKVLEGEFLNTARIELDQQLFVFFACSVLLEKVGGIVERTDDRFAIIGANWENCCL